MTWFRSRVVLLAALAFTLCAGLTGPVLAQEATPASEEITIYGPDEMVGGATLGEWEARNWQWAVSMPESVNPNFDSTGESCGYGQSGPVFFLPASYGPEVNEPITCVVPHGVALFVGVAGSECSTVEPPPFFGRDEAELAACATAFTDEISEMEASIDGQPVPDLEQYRAVSPLFSMLFPEDNFFGVPAGVALSVADGYSFIIAPPPPGEYEISVSVLFEGEDAPLAITNRVIVQEPQIIEPVASPEASPMATPVS
jgi:hypothetical protein